MQRKSKYYFCDSHKTKTAKQLLDIINKSKQQNEKLIRIDKHSNYPSKFDNLDYIFPVDKVTHHLRLKDHQHTYWKLLPNQGVKIITLDSPLVFQKPSQANARMVDSYYMESVPSTHRLF